MGVYYVLDKDSLIIEVQMGFFKDDVLSGWGCVYGPDIGLYMGDFISGNLSGFGLHIGPDKEMIIGVFKNNKCNRPYADKGDLEAIFTSPFRLKDYLYDADTYNLNIFDSGHKISLIKNKLGGIDRRMVFDEKEKILFISGALDDAHGRVIYAGGDIYDAVIDGVSQDSITVGNQWYK